MTVTPMSDNLNIIAALSDRPNATDGLTAAQLKAKYDQGPGLIKTYINGTLVTAVDLAQLGSVSRQSAINGNFAVNQLAKSGTVTLAAGAYGHDMWKAGASGCTYTFATSNNVTTITISAGSLIQVIEGINLFSGTYTLSWTGTSQGKIGSGSYGASGITGTVVGGTNLNIEFNTGTLSQVQFNAGSTALPFQPRSFAEEERLCLRYYFKTFPYAIAPVQNGGFPGAIIVQLPNAASSRFGYKLIFPVQMRTQPTVTTYNPAAANASWRDADSSADRTVTVTDNSETSISIRHTDGLGAANSYNAIQVTADARL